MVDCICIDCLVYGLNEGFIMTRLIKKYKNRRLYDTEISQYITLQQLENYVTQGILFRIEDSQTGKDLTNNTLLQIIIEMEAGPTQFLSPDILRQIITLAKHPMHASFKLVMEQMFNFIEKPSESDLYSQTSEMWNNHLQNTMKEWQNIFKT